MVGDCWNGIGGPMRSSEEAAVSSSVADEARLALEVPAWAWRFYLRHLGLAVGISLIPAAQRAVSQLAGARLPGAAAVAGEIVTAGARLLLVFLIFRLAILAEERVRGMDGAEAWRRVGRFARHHWRSLVVQVVLVAILFLIFDRIPEAVIAPRVPEAARAGYWAALLALKNPTVIAFTLIWQVGILRQMILEAPEASGTAAGSGRSTAVS